MPSRRIGHALSNILRAQVLITSLHESCPPHLFPVRVAQRVGLLSSTSIAQIDLERRCFTNLHKSEPPVKHKRMLPRNWETPRSSWRTDSAGSDVRPQGTLVTFIGNEPYVVTQQERKVEGAQSRHRLESHQTKTSHRTPATDSTASYEHVRVRPTRCSKQATPSDRFVARKRTYDKMIRYWTHGRVSNEGEKTHWRARGGWT